MKILIVHPCKGFHGGAEEVITQLTHYIYQKTDHDVFVVTKNAPEDWILLKERFAINTNSWWDFYREVRESMEGAGVVNVHNAPAPLMTFPKKIPTVYYCNEPMEMFTTWWRKPTEALNRWWIRKSGMKVVVADQPNIKRFEGIYGITPSIVPYGVNYDFWSKGYRAPSNEIPSFTILQVGTITPYKNQLESIKTVEKLRKTVPAKLILIGSKGDREYFEEISSYILDHGLLSKVRLVEHMSHEELRDWYCKSSVLLHPIKDQGGWLAPFEALCAGLPIVVSKEFTGSSIVKDNELGVVTDDYLGAVQDIYKNEINYGIVTSEAGEWIKENLTWDKFGESVVRILEEAVR